MSILKVDTSNPELLTKRTFEPITPGKYACEVANNLKIEPSNSSANSIVKIELRVTDDGKFKGRKVFDNLVIGATPDVAKKTDWKIAQFAIACGVCTKDTLDQIELENFIGCVCEVNVGIKTEEYKGETKAKNYVKEYMFEIDK